METDAAPRLTAQSTLAELPAYGTVMDLATPGESLAAALAGDPRLPGVVLADGGALRGAISRRQYLQLVGRQFGRELYHPRPLRVMLRALELDGEPLVLASHVPIQEAVRRSLERPAELIYEPVLVRGPLANGDASSVAMIDFPDLLRADSRVSALRNQQMKEILATVQEGFLLVDREFRIAAEHSRSLERIFAVREIAGRRLPEVLAEVLGGEAAELAVDYMETLFNPGVIEKLVTDVNPLRRVATRAGGGERARHLAFRFVRSLEGDAIRRLLVRVEDVTREVELAAELAEQGKKARENVDLALDVVRVDARVFGGFLAALDREIRRGEELLAGGGQESAKERLATVFRGVHALKGEASLLGLDIYRTAIHRCEDALAVRENPDAADLERIRPGLARLAELSAETHGLIERFRTLGVVGRTAAEEGLFEAVARLVRELGERLGKSARFVSRAAESDVPPAYRGLVREALVQLARNSLVHGLEPAEERLRRGKPAQGTLQLAVRRHPDKGRLELVFQDDGRGLDRERIRRRARELGIEVRDDAALDLLIFESGFSTAAETTHDAGRGVGLDVVKARVERHGGYVRPFSEAGAYCAFQIVLPLEEP